MSQCRRQPPWRHRLRPRLPGLFRRFQGVFPGERWPCGCPGTSRSQARLSRHGASFEGAGAGCAGRRQRVARWSRREDPIVAGGVRFAPPRTRRAVVASVLVMLALLVALAQAATKLTQNRTARAPSAPFRCPMQTWGPASRQYGPSGAARQPTGVSYRDSLRLPHPHACR